MAVLSVIPRNGQVRMEDLRDTINSGDYGGDATNVLGSFFAVSINKWARYKPVIYATTAKLTDAQLKSVNYGLSMPSATAFTQNLATIQAVCNKSWVYNCPTGGASQPLRVSDFCGYYPNAEAPIQVVGTSWEVNKAISKELRISVDADPGDSTYQLQAYDFSGGALDLPHCTLYGCIASGSSVVAWLQAKGTLVDSSGNIGVTWIDHDCSNLNGRYTVYLCLKYTNGSNTYLYPLPEGHGGYSLNVTTNAAAAGVGISNDFTDVAFAPAFGGTYYTAQYATDNGSGTQAMYNSTGEMLLRVKFTSTATSAVTINRTDFSLSAVYGLGYSSQKTAERMFTSAPASYGNGVNSATIPAKGTLTIWLYVSEILAVSRGTNKNYTIEVGLNYKGQNIYGADLYYYKASGAGWTAR